MIRTEKEYKILTERIEILLKDSNNIENELSDGYIELNLLSDLVAEYEETNFAVPKPTLVESIKTRMLELKINQTNLSQLLGVSSSRISEYLTGKSEPTLKVAREISKKLNIDPNIVLGV